jgi:hypothetical protein
MYIFNIYEIEIKIGKDTIPANGISKTFIELVPVNAVGTKAPFRNIVSTINFTEGKELVDIIIDKKNKIVFRSKSIPGKVIIKIESDYLLYPNKYLFNIKSSEAS